MERCSKIVYGCMTGRKLQCLLSLETTPRMRSMHKCARTIKLGTAGLCMADSVNINYTPGPSVRRSAAAEL